MTKIDKNVCRKEQGAAEPGNTCLETPGTCESCPNWAKQPITAILKTWPAFMPPKKVLEVFTHDWGNFYFTLGRGKPKQRPAHLWYTHRGRILGYFEVWSIVRNDGSLPKLRSLSDVESEWQIKGDAWVAICKPPFHRLKERVYHEGFRGWRYFDLDSYRKTPGAKLHI